MKRKLLFVSSAIQQPRHQRRINAFDKMFDVSVLFAIRDGYKENIKELKVRSKNLGVITRKKGKFFYLLSRFTVNLRIWSFLLIRDRSSILYLTAPDQALLAMLACRKFFIEYGDIQALSSQSRLSKILDRTICRVALGVTVTSPAYYSKYFATLGLQKERLCIAENKIPNNIANFIISSSAELPSEEVEVQSGTLADSQRTIRLGLIGALSRFEIYEIYRNIIRGNSNYRLQIYGDSGSTCLFPNEERICFHGAFRNPEDLKRIYESIDIVLINYDAKDANVQIALPNKLYEAMLFRKPVVCTNDTYLAEVVTDKGIGFSCDLNELGIENAIKQCVKYDFSHAWQRIDRSDYISDNDHVASFVSENSP